MANDYITAQPALVEGSLESATLRPAGVGTVSREAVRPETAACHPHVPPRPVLWERSHGSTRATWDPRPGCGNSPLMGFSRTRVKRRLQQQRGRETV